MARRNPANIVVTIFLLIILALAIAAMAGPQPATVFGWATTPAQQLENTCAERGGYVVVNGDSQGCSR
jgi:cytochrome b561